MHVFLFLKQTGMRWLAFTFSGHHDRSAPTARRDPLSINRLDNSVRHEAAAREAGVEGIQILPKFFRSISQRQSSTPPRPQFDQIPRQGQLTANYNCIHCRHELRFTSVTRQSSGCADYVSLAEMYPAAQLRHH
jgi:hypothetical protein